MGTIAYVYGVLALFVLRQGERTGDSMARPKNYNENKGHKLIERQNQLDQLLQLSDSAVQGRGHIALVNGEAGVGKTALLNVLITELPATVETYWGSCDALFTPRPLGPVFDMSPALGGVVQSALKNKDTSALFNAVFARLSEAENGVVLVFEDVHWADHATLDLLKFLGRRMSVLPVIMILSFRSDELDELHPLTQVLGDLPTVHTHRVDLTPLSQQGVQILADAAGYSKDDLYNITAGNPFFATELLACAEFSAADIPASIRDTVGARLMRLDGVEREFIEVLSLIPGAASAALCQHLFGDAADELALGCVDRNLLVIDVNGALKFRHELARLATLARLSVTRQKQGNERILAALLVMRTGKNFDQLVHHAAGALNAKAVLKYAPQAAKLAGSLGGHREAAAHLATALKFVDEATLPEAAQLHEDWSYEASLVQLLDDEVLEARRHAITLWRALERDEKVGENMRWLSRLHWYRGEAAQANRYADDAVRILESIPPSAERALAYSVRSQLHMLNDRMDEAVEWGQRALAMAEDFDSVEVKIHALNNVGTALLLSLRVEGQPMLEQSLALALENDFHEHAARVYTNLAEYAVLSRQFDLAERVIADGIAFDTKHDLDAWTYYLVGRFAELRLEQGRLLDAQTIAEGVLELDTLTLLMRLPALTVLAKVKLRMGAPDAASLLSQALHNALATDELQYIVPVRMGLIESAWLSGNLADAEQHLNYLDSLDPQLVSPRYIGELAIWAQRCEFELKNNDPLKQEQPLSEPFASEIRRDFQAAARLWERKDSPYAAAMALLQVTGEDQSAVYGKALHSLSSIQAHAAINKAHNLAQSFGIGTVIATRSRGPYKAAKSHPLGLTKREQQILGLIVSGATNQEMSEKLSRSRRTVEHHVSSVLAKLNASSRVDVMLRVQNEPWLLAR